MNKPYIVKEVGFDATRRYAVVATFRSFNPVIARYIDKADAQRRARDMNRRSTVPAHLIGKYNAEVAA